MKQKIKSTLLSHIIVAENRATRLIKIILIFSGKESNMLIFL